MVLTIKNKEFKGDADKWLQKWGCESSRGWKKTVSGYLHGTLMGWYGTSIVAIFVTRYTYIYRERDLINSAWTHQMLVMVLVFRTWGYKWLVIDMIDILFLDVLHNMFVRYLTWYAHPLIDRMWLLDHPQQVHPWEHQGRHSAWARLGVLPAPRGIQPSQGWHFFGFLNGGTVCLSDEHIDFSEKHDAIIYVPSTFIIIRVYIYII